MIEKYGRKFASMAELRRWEAAVPPEKRERPAVECSICRGRHPSDDRHACE